MNLDTGINAQWFLTINDFAVRTPWLHGIVLGYATYGVVLFGALLLWGTWRSRHASDRSLAASVWAALLGRLLTPLSGWLRVQPGLRALFSPAPDQPASLGAPAPSGAVAG